MPYNARCSHRSHARLRDFTMGPVLSEGIRLCLSPSTMEAFPKISHQHMGSLTSSILGKSIPFWKLTSFLQVGTDLKSSVAWHFSVTSEFLVENYGWFLVYIRVCSFYRWYCGTQFILENSTLRITTFGQPPFFF
jgi:hypothetical protein